MRQHPCRRIDRNSLTWDFDLSSPEIPAEIRSGFQSLQRLPLYVCSQCSVLSYRIVDDQNIACFPHDQQLEWCDEDESYYQEVRAEIERQPIHLHLIPPAIDELWRKTRDWEFDESLDPDGARTLQEYYESLKIDPVDPSYYSQLGGSPYWIQGPRPMACPNKQCVAWQDDEDESDIIEMKHLAHNFPTRQSGIGRFSWLL